MTSRVRTRLVEARIALREACDGLPAAERLWADMAPGMKAQAFGDSPAGRSFHAPEESEEHGRYAISDPTGDAATKPDHFRREQERLETISRRIANLANEARAIIHSSTVERPLMAKELQELALSADPGCEVVGRIERPGGGTFWEEVHVHATTVGGVLDRPYRMGAWAEKFVKRNGRLPTDVETRAHCEGRRVMVKS